MRRSVASSLRSVRIGVPARAILALFSLFLLAERLGNSCLCADAAVSVSGGGSGEISSQPLRCFSGVFYPCMVSEYISLHLTLALSARALSAFLALQFYRASTFEETER